MTASIGTSTRPFVSPTIVDFGSIADHTYGPADLFGVSPSGARIQCNAGRGNGPEPGGSSSSFVDPRDGGRGPGPFPTGDCDPGNSGPVNRGGD
jgi:hypothetical protein